MTKISIITIFPELYDQFLKTSLVGRATTAKLVSFNLVKLSDLCKPKERIDEPICGPGSGMIIKPEVIERAIEQCEKVHGSGYKIFFSPQGIKLTQKVLQKLAGEKPKNFLPPSFSQKNLDQQTDNQASLKHIILICPRYEGMDARVEKHYADALLSIGDYVLMGGDLPAQVFLEGFLRLVPGIVGKQESVEKESFSNHLLDYPQFGLPVEWNGEKIPKIVLSGNHEAIEVWRQEEACSKTLLDRFDWFREHTLTRSPLLPSDLQSKSYRGIASCQKQIPHHYIALMHTDVVLKVGKDGQTRVGHTSVTSLDLHDTARSCATYGVKNMFMVSPLKDQQAIMNDLLSFWKSDKGKKYNFSRFEAVSRVHPTTSLTETIDFITKQEGGKPLVVTTSAKTHQHPQEIDYFSQGQVWKHHRPVLFVFGTGQGLCDKIIDECDFLLVPVEGMTNYKHLSVRSAVAIILDRWLGLQPKLIK